MHAYMRERFTKLVSEEVQRLPPSVSFPSMDESKVMRLILNGFPHEVENQ